MDEFGVLVESMGFRAQGKSTPLAELKPKPKSQVAARGSANAQPFDTSYSLPMDDLGGVFQSNTNPSKPQQPQNFFGGDDVFGGPVLSSQKHVEVDLESVFSSSNKSQSSGDHLNSRNSPGFDDVDDLLGLKSKQGDHIDDLFGSFGMNSNKKQEARVPGLDDLIPGFGEASNSKTNTFDRRHSETNSRPPTSSMPVVDDPFLVFESSVSKSDASWPYGTPSDDGTGKLKTNSSFDDFDDFIMGAATSGSTTDDGIRTSSNKPSSGMDFDDFIMGAAATSGSTIRTSSSKPSSGMDSNRFDNTNFVDDIFGGGNGGEPNNTTKPSSVDEDSLFGDFLRAETGPEVKQNSTHSFSTKKTTISAAKVNDDFASVFGEVTTSSGVFHEIEGESKERRAARLNRHIRTNERMAEALAEKTQRDLQTQLEQEERRRLAQTLDNNIRRWAAGKEGNLRALLSSLQEVLWPDSGWRPVSLTDMITSDSVKKVYKKATLCVHPDKVQQKGASTEHKYIAEKVFDLLKEAWNKFCTEELR